jgi:hypothetical protein
MEFLHTAVALLASMVLVLAGMVGWLYWQQTRISQNMNSIIMVIGELARPPPPVYQPEPEPVPEEEVKPTNEDDRVSVKEEEEEVSSTEVVEGPPPIDTDGLESKTTAELRDILTKRGIPFGKRDNKSALISLLKATA